MPYIPAMRVTLHLGGQSADYIHIEFDLPDHPAISDFNWASADVPVVLDGLEGHTRPQFTVEDVMQFADDLAVLNDTLRGSVKSSSMEGQMDLELLSRESGRINAFGFITGQSGHRNALNFEVALGQSYLPPVVSELNKMKTEWLSRA